MSDGMKRRDFLKTVSVGGATLTAACKSDGVERLIPYVVPSEEIVPGVPTWYSTTCRECPAGCGMHVETHEGRATKVEGNPIQPISRGNLCARGQASVQGLYHPDRLQGPQVVEEGLEPRNITWGGAEQTLARRIRELQSAGRGASIAFLTERYTGTMDRLVDDWVRAIGARRVVYDPYQDQPRNLQFADADFLISFGADFLETWGSPVDYAWQFAQMRSPMIGQRGKFVWVAPHQPLTGLNADEWVAPRPGTEALVAQAIAGTVDVNSAAQQTGVQAQVLQRLATEFRGARKAVAMGPGQATAGSNASALQAAVDRLNGRASAPQGGDMRPLIQLVQQMRAGQVQMLLISAHNPVYTLPGGLGFEAALRRVPDRVSFSTFPDETAMLCTLRLPDHHFLEQWNDYVPRPDVRALVQPTMRPVFNTKQTGDVLLSVARYLRLNTVTPGNNGATYYDYLRNAWGGGTGDAWREIVKRGGSYPAVPAGPNTAAEVAGAVPPFATQPASGTAAGTANVNAPAVPGLEGTQQVVTPTSPPSLVTALPVATGSPVSTFEGGGDARFHLVVYPSYRFFDGRTANRPWLLELPDPVTKVPWTSWAELHPASAKELGVRQGEILEIRSPFGAVRVPAYVYPGVRRDVVAIQTGLGHKAFGRYTENRGVNPNLLLGPTAAPTGAFAPYSVRVSVQGTGEKSGELYEQGNRVQLDREIAQAVSLSEMRAFDAVVGAKVPGTIPGQNMQVETLRGHGGFQPVETPTDPAAYPPPGTEYGQYTEGKTRWAMVIDNDRCIGCGACVTACYAENNIPVVGPDQVRKGREMSWLRIERYFGVTQDQEEALRDDATSDVRFLPMLCQHCGNAPCEPVCPVYAAYHTPDGLNAQVYNRCVGTRYCANNCPYKVRYFNWFTYQFAAPLHWQLNPDVTVREKGVMEKCTFCVQRINEGQRNASLEGRPLNDSEVTPACVQTCPAEVFVFGNIADPNSAVARAAASNRSYRILEAQNTQPAIVYLQKVTLREPKKGHHADEMYGKRGEAGREHGGAAGTGSTGSQLEPHRAPAGAGSH